MAKGDLLMIRIAGKRRAFTLLELMIAIGILGTGLIMVAAVFPVALAQHRDISESFLGQRLATKAASIVRSRLQSETVYIPPPNFYAGLSQYPPEPRPVVWFPIPAEIMPVGQPPGQFAWYGATNNNGAPTTGGLATALRVFNRLAGFAIPNTSLTELPLALTNTMLISRNDMFLGAAPESDVTREARARYVWYGFYSTGQVPPQSANGAAAASPPRLAIAVCRAPTNQLYAIQDFTDLTTTGGVPNRPTPFGDYAGNIRAISPNVSPFSRLPMPWRIEVKRQSEPPQIDSPVLFDAVPATSGLSLGEIAPAGTKLFNAETGQVYTVARTLDLDGDANHIQEAIEIREPPSTLPIQYDITGRPPVTAQFHIYFFPPALQSLQVNAVRNFGTETPCLDFYFF